MATESRSSVRGFGYHNQDLTLMKNTRMGGGTNFQFRFEMFNMWNWHIFNAPGVANNGLSAFDTDIWRVRHSASGMAP